MNQGMIRVVGSVALAALLFVPVEAGDKPACTATIPANVITSDAEVIRGLQLDSFTASRNKKSLPIASAVVDSGARRIVVILHGGPDLNVDKWEQEAQVVWMGRPLPRQDKRQLVSEVLVRILGNARPQDSFALIASGKDAVRVPFGETPQALLARFLQWKTAPQPVGKNRLFLLDAIEQAAAWLQPNQRGDSILIFDGGDDALYGGNYGRALKALLAGGIRVFSAQFGTLTIDAQAGTPAAHKPPCEFIPEAGHWNCDPPSRHPERSGTLRALAWESGGYMISDWVWRPPGANQRFDDFSDLGWEMYRAISDFYLLTLGPMPASRPFSWKLDVSSQVLRNVPYAMVAYPAKLRPCSFTP